MPAALVEAYDGAGVSLLRFPIDDMGVPASGAEFSAFLQQIGARMAAGEGVYVHCLAGVGRTAAYSDGSDPSSPPWCAMA